LVLAEEEEKPAQPVPLTATPTEDAAEVAPEAEPDAEADEKTDEIEWPETLGDPRAGEVPLPSSGGWNAFLVLDNSGVGVWTVKSFPVFPRLACPEVVGLDDRGRCLVLTNYSGKWAALETLQEGVWLGGLEHGDLDPRIPGSELYTGSQLGNVYQVITHPEGHIEHRRIGRIEGRAVNTIVAGELDAAPGAEIVIFTWPGGLYVLRPDGPRDWSIEHLGDVPGRIRDAVILPGDGAVPEMATVSRNGRIELLSLTADGPRWRRIYEAPMGLGRIAMRPSRSAAPLVLYATHDDGRILRLTRGAGEKWQVETIYLGPQGPRGIAAGRFTADPDTESVAIYGYSGRVELLTRKGDAPWKVETLFQDPDKGHWIAVCEVDGRNATDELVASGFGGRIVLLARPPGYGRTELAVEED
jgi:hypothetical protein